ncbi:response regulator [Anaerocolumna sp. MB42-C2]|uniref:response regulator n=1 Tax=Anaerocolumna sp. MB42-C2 TaxID=3070997 RepID=UPI0027E1A58F|nr:response regulator [Anaerocolumna sp. MB42-C2]WMJ89898.1 response regulator [Anaerocolumna sp. MB42-C2]
MIRAIVVDDEWYTLEEISDLILLSGKMEVIKKYQNPVKVLEEINSLSVDVAFIDIEMPEIDGLTLAERIMEVSPDTSIVFVTSWNQYAVQAFDLNAVDYIMKPVRKERFQKMLDKIQIDRNRNKPSESSELTIRCFGKFDIFIGGTPVKWERAKAEELFAYLLMNHDSYVHKDLIIDNLWPDYEPQRALPILQTAICRIRTIFSEVRDELHINYSGNKYCLAAHNVDCDYFEVNQALSRFDKDDKNTYLSIDRAFLIYDKGFLSQQGYIWSMERDEEFRKTFVKILREIIGVFQCENDINELIRYYKDLAVLLPYDEEVNYTLIDLFKKSGYHSEALNHYMWLIKILLEQYDTKPSERIRKFFE